MGLKAKYILHASKVDRIAIVDRPAVPNANILVFKRLGTSVNAKVESHLKKFLKSDFSDTFCYSAVDAAVGSLEQGIYYALMNERGDKKEQQAQIDELFSQFSDVLGKVQQIVTGMKFEKDAGDLPTVDELLSNYEQSASMSEFQSAMGVFRQYIGMVMCWGAEFKDSAKAIAGLIDSLKAKVMEAAQAVVSKGLKLEEPMTLEKEGRIVASRRLAKLKEMHALLWTIINETESTAAENRRRRGGVKIMDKAQQDKLAETLKALGEKISSLDSRLAALEGKSEKSAEVDKALADAQVALKSLAETVEAVKNAHDSAIKPLTEGMTPLNEKAAKLEADLAAEKSAREKSDARLDKMEKALAAYQTSIDTIGKRLGVRTSVEGDNKNDKNESGKDVFGDAVRGKKA
jgi:DNA repair exonuclease SbcCD ATPase subunit